VPAMAGKLKPVLVRCLGPGKKDHAFWSMDPRAVRVCPRCRKEQDRLHLSVRHTDVPLSVGAGGPERPLLE
jgi:hypothetical protein